MRTRILLAAVALSASAIAVAQTETTTPATNNALEPVPVEQQEPAAPARVLQQDCLLIAGNNTWKALGLSDDQITRLAALQERHKAEIAPPVEEKDVKGKKKAAATKKAEPAVGKTEVIDKTGVEADKQPAQAELDPSKAAPTDNTGTQAPGETTAPDAVTEPLQPVALSVNDELRTILTPEQYALWSTQCAEIVTQPTSMR